MAVVRSSVRGPVLRSAIVFSPFCALSLFGLAYIVADVVADGFDVGHVVGIVIVGFMAFLLSFQVIQSIRDFFAATVETVGVVERQWSRHEFMLFRNGYIFVKNDVYRLDPVEYAGIKLGDTVRVTHSPHTATVERVEVVQRAERS